MINLSICMEESVVIHKRINANNFGGIKLYDWSLKNKSIVNKQVVH